MNSKSQKIIITVDNGKDINWKLDLKNKFKKLRASNLEIDCKDLDLSCSDILELIEIANLYKCKIISFLSTSLNTIISSKSLGYQSHFFVESFSNSALETSAKDLNISQTDFHQGTVRSGEYIESPGDLLILGDVNPGAIVSAKGNIIIWGRLLGIAHAGIKGDSKATISALQLRPVQLRISNKIARGPEEKPQLGLAEQARIKCEKIIIYPLESLYSKN
tara:strand:+ start:101 stop:760 length:660 start_codon:yes stop_codon:yes gene_type:complete